MQTKERKEVDFALVCNSQIEKLIEVKYADPSISPHVRYFHEKYKLSAVQLVKELKREKIEQGIEIVEAANFLKTLDLQE